jgi:hypothetical protein
VRWVGRFGYVLPLRRADCRVRSRFGRLPFRAQLILVALIDLPLRSAFLDSRVFIVHVGTFSFVVTPAVSF